jgi:hypothetical protein
VVGTRIDITERRSAEEAMNRLNRDLKCQAINKEL